MEQILQGEARAAVLRQLPRLLLPWYDKNKRDLPWRKDTDPYRVWVSEIMLQQTRVEAAKEHYIRFLRELPTVQALAACPEERLLKLWEGLGYYSRARNLQKAARIVAAEGFPDTAEGWKKLPGIGDYTAGAIVSIAFQKPAAAVDGNVIRVLSRLLGDARPAEALKTSFQKELQPALPQGRCGDFTQSLMELGATVCLPASPLCLTCPLLALCQTKSDALPLPKAKPARRQVSMTLFLFMQAGKAALFRRTAGVLQGMYGFFYVEEALSPAAARQKLQKAGLQNFALGAPQAHRHVFTHIEWDMAAYLVQLPPPAPADAAPQGFSPAAEGPLAAAAPQGFSAAAFDAAFAPAAHADAAALEWYAPAEIRKNISLPPAFRWCLPLLSAAEGEKEG